jgi:hypothetical protein
MHDYLSIPGYVPVKQAARLIGFSQERVLQHVRAGHFDVRVVDGRYMIAEQSVAAFERKPHGRVRTKPTPWRHYRTACVWMLRIDAPIVPGQQDALTRRVYEMADQQQQHCFPGTLHRFVSVENERLSVLLVWKSTEMDEATLERDLEAFRTALADVVDWMQAREVRCEAVAYT